MHRTLLSLATAAVVSTAAFLPSQASAMTIGTAPGIAAAIEASNLLEDVRYVCRHRWNTSGRRCYWRPATVCRHSWRTSRRFCYRR
jgi:hypothetical protein